MNHNLRQQAKPDYVSINSGTTCEGGPLSRESVAEDPPRFDFNASNCPEDRDREDRSAPEDDLDLAIVQLRARKELLVAEEHREACESIRRDLQREVDELTARSVNRSRSRAQSRGPPAAQSLEQPFAQPDPLQTFAQPDPLQTSLHQPVSRRSLEINLRDLRDLSDLSAKVDADLMRAGLAEPQRERGDSGKVGVGVNSFHNNNNNRSSCVSGRDAKVRDSVVHPLVWPHTALQYTYVSGDISYGKLDFPLLVAGELAILSSCKSASELKGRMHLLQKVAYFSKDYTWNATRAFH